MAKRSPKLPSPDAGSSRGVARRPRRVKTFAARAGWVFLSGVLLSLAFAPINQFYLAWVGLVPWLGVVGSSRTPLRAFFWSWLAGTLFFSGNMWWLGYVTFPGLVALMILLGLYWAVPGLLIRALGLFPALASPGGSLAPPDEPTWAAATWQRSPLLTIVATGAIWVAFEWLRATAPFNGLPWLQLGHAQTPFLAFCQIADFSGVYGVSFIVASINAWVTLLLLHRRGGRPVRPLIPSGVVVAGLFIAALGYGAFRFSEAPRFASPGPTVLVVQPNYPQDNSGQKSVRVEDRLEEHLRLTQDVLASHPDVDLVIWSETMMPELNAEARYVYRTSENKKAADYGRFLDETDARIGRLMREHHSALLTGAVFFDAIDVPGQVERRLETRNAAYLYGRDGRQVGRYDKIHLVPFGEYIPFQRSWPWLYRQLIAMGPPDMDSYQLGRGTERVVFRLPRPQGGEPWRFVTPICFEDIDGPTVAAMFRDGAGGVEGGRKPADLVVNLTNDGWFLANENAQHLQAAVFRSIENRAPTARSVNTGISGFIDAMGRVDRSKLVPARTTGTSVAQLALDGRRTFYSRFGDLFADSCAAATALMTIAALFRWMLSRRTSSLMSPGPGGDPTHFHTRPSIHL